MQDLNDMRYFAEVVDHNGFAAAARALGLPTSRLSRRIARMEATLGVRLLQRTTRTLSLTAAGEGYYRHCVAVREQAEQAADELRQTQSEPRGPLRVVCPVTLAQSVIGPLLPAYLARHPLVRLELQVSNRVVNLVEEGVDVALRVRTRLDDSSVVARHLGLSHGLLVASPALLHRQGTPASPADLGGLDVVSMSAPDGRIKWALTGPQGAQAVATCRPIFVADDLLTLRYAVLGGIGVGSLPDYMVQQDLADGALVHVLPAWSLAPGIVHAVYSSRRGMAPAIRTFLDFLDQEISRDGHGA